MPTPKKGAGGKFVAKGAEPAPEQPGASEPEPTAPEVEHYSQDREIEPIARPLPDDIPVDPSDERCDSIDKYDRRCLYVKHDPAYPHVYDLNEATKVETPIPTTEAARVPVAKVKNDTWWCGRCDNAQLVKDNAVCRKCGAVPEFPAETKEG